MEENKSYAKIIAKVLEEKHQFNGQSYTIFNVVNSCEECRLEYKNRPLKYHCHTRIYCNGCAKLYYWPGILPPRYCHICAVEKNICQICGEPYYNNKSS